MCGLKLFEEVYAAGHDNVTPSRVCGLKHVYLYVIRQKKQSHTLTGVWIETHSISSPGTMARGHTLTGVWIETRKRVRLAPFLRSHTLTGVWIETLTSDGR